MLMRILTLLLTVVFLMGTGITIYAAAPTEEVDTTLDEDEIRDILDEDDVLVRPIQEGEMDITAEEYYYPDSEHLKVIKSIKGNYDIMSENYEALGVWKKPPGEYVERMTRGEFAALVTRFIASDWDVGTNSYADVPETHPYRSDIEVLMSMGVIDFPEDAIFRPDDFITIDEAMSMLLNALGYKQFLTRQLSYPANVLQLAIGKNIIDGLTTMAGNGFINQMDALYIIENALEVEVMEQAQYAEKYQYISEVPAIEFYHGITKKKGIVMASGSSYIPGAEPLAEAYVNIDGVIMRQFNYNFLDLLGQKVDFFYRSTEVTGNGEDELILVIERPAYNRVVKINGNFIKAISKNRIEYIDMDTGDNRSANISHIKEAVFNYFEPAVFTAEDLQGLDMIKLVDNGSGAFDVMFLFKTTTHFINEVNLAENQAYDYYARDVIKLYSNPDDKNDDANIIYCDANFITVGKRFLQDKSVISIGKSYDGLKTRIVIVNNAFSAVPNEIEIAEGQPRSIILNDKLYYFRNSENMFTRHNEIKVGNNYTFYTDYMGRIAAYLPAQTAGWMYGFLIKSIPSGAFEEKLSMKVFTFLEGMRMFDTAERVVLDSNSPLKGEKLYEKLEQATKYHIEDTKKHDHMYEVPLEIKRGNILYSRMPIMYRLNDAGEIYEIDTPYTDINEDVNRRDSEFGRQTLNRYNAFSYRSSSATNPGGVFLRNTLAFNEDRGNVVEITSGVVILIVPHGNDYDIIDNDDNYERRKLNYLKDWTNYPADKSTVPNRLEAYNVAENRVSPFLVYHLTLKNTEISRLTPLTIVTKISEGIDEDGALATYLHGYQYSDEVKVKLAQGVSLTREFNGYSTSEPDENGEIKVTSQVKRGDIIRYETNSMDELYTYVKLFSLKDEDDPVLIRNENLYDPKAPQPVNPDKTVHLTMLAVSDGKYEAKAFEEGRKPYDVQHIYSNTENYNDAFRLVYRTVLYREGINLVLESLPKVLPEFVPGTGVVPGTGRNYTTEIAQAIPYNFVCIDEVSDKIYVPSYDEIISSYSTSFDEATKVILHTGGGSQKQLIIVRRAKE